MQGLVATGAGRREESAAAARTTTYRRDARQEGQVGVGRLELGRVDRDVEGVERLVDCARLDEHADIDNALAIASRKTKSG